MRVRLLYEGVVPAEVQAVLQPLVAKWEWIIPSICHELRVSFVSEEVEDGTLMAVQLSPEYRACNLRVYPLWLKETKKERERSVVHELCHIVVAPLTEFTDDIIRRTGKPTSGVLREQHRRLYEGVVVDLTQSLLEQRKRRKVAR